MKNKIPAMEIAMTAVIFLVAAFGIISTVKHRVPKGVGELTTENYTQFMQIDCSLGNGSGSGYEICYKYYITVSAQPYYNLQDVTLHCSLESDEADLPDDTLYFTVEAGKKYTKEYESVFTVTVPGNHLGTWKAPTLKITVKSVTGTYKYNI